MATSAHRKTRTRRQAGVHEEETGLARLVALALDQDRLGGIDVILEDIATAADVYGCILWKMEPGPTSLGFEGNLYVLAQWFEGDAACVVHDLPPNRSLTGKAIAEGRPRMSNDVPEDSEVARHDRFLVDNDIRRMCTFPLLFQDDTRGALNLYRRKGPRFSAENVRRLERIAALLPRFEGVLLDKTSSRLLFELEEVLGGGSLHGASKGTVETLLGQACEVLRAELSSLEVALFLEDQWERPGLFRRMATTWPEAAGDLGEDYDAEGASGLTGWVLRRGEGLRLFDLMHAQRDRSTLESTHPDLVWKKDEFPESRVRERLGLVRDEPLPPLSFLCSPILSGNRTIGALRCFGATGRGPLFFGSREQALLSLVAQQIGRFWLDWLHRRNLEEENRSWKELVNSVTSLNRFVYNEFKDGALDEGSIFSKALDVTQSVIRNAEITDVRLRDPETNELYFAAHFGKAWGQGEAEEVEKRKTKRFPLDDETFSAGAWVFHNNRVRRLKDVEEDPYYDVTFPSARRMLIAPISVEDEVFGVLDIRSTGEAALPPHADDIAELLGKQLGLYHYLATTIGELQETKEYQQQAIEDLTHQLRNPLSQAQARLQQIVGQMSGAGDRRLRAVRGLIAKAHRVARSTRLFVELAKNEAIQVNLEPASEEWLVPVLIEAAEDSEILLDPRRNIRAKVEREGFASLRNKRVFLDRRLVEQAVTNLLDNATKYSYPNTTVRVFGGVTKTGRLQICVANHGIRLSSKDARKATEREWRSEMAELTTAEGSGLGLWIVGHIARAHGGELQVQPTDPEGWTFVRLLLPLAKE